MRSKTMAMFAALALTSASTAIAAQPVRPAVAPEPASEVVDEGSAAHDGSLLGVIFGLGVIALLIWLLGGEDELEPSSP